MSITSIFHVADIHIRAGTSQEARQDEYLGVFNRLFSLLKGFKAIQDGTGIIVVAGDVFHNKSILGPSGIELGIYFMKGLSELATTVVIRGNHDYSQHRADEKDLISAIVANNIPDLHYFNETGIYEVENIGFGVLAIQDTLISGATGGSIAVEEQPPFPEPVFSEEVTHKVALFHGEVTKASLQTGYVRTSHHSYPLKKFEGYDLVLLGDIHMQQVKVATQIETDATPTNATPTDATPLRRYTTKTGSWGYPSSLLQQNYGEALVGHGLLHWDLTKNEVTEYHIHNDYGFVPLSIDASDKIRIQIKKGCVEGSWVGEEVLAEPWFPLKLRVSVICEGITCTTAPLDRHKGRLEGHGKVVVAIHPSYGVTTTVEANVSASASAEQVAESQPSSIASLNSPAMWTQYILENCTDRVVKENTLWTEWFKIPTLALIPAEGIPPKLDPVLNMLNDKPLKAVGLFQKSLEEFQQEERQVAAVSFQYLEWSWLFNFGAENHFNFTELNSANSLVILNAKNGSGKSNFLETICVSLFGEGFPSRENNNYSASILNRTGIGSGSGSGSPRSRIVFSYNGQNYSIERVFDWRVNQNLLDYKSVILANADTGDILFQGVNAVKEWVKAHIGTVDTFLASSMLSQNGDCNFFEKSADKQKQFLDSLFSLHVIDHLKTFLDQSAKAHASIIGHLQSYQNGLTNRGGGEDALVTSETVAETEEDLRQTRMRVSELDRAIATETAAIAAWPPRTFTSKSLAAYREELDAYGDLAQDTYSSYTVDALQEERTRLRMRIETLQRQIGVGDGLVVAVAKPTGTRRGLDVRRSALLEELEQVGTVATVASARHFSGAKECRTLLDDYRGWKEGWRLQLQKYKSSKTDLSLAEAEAEEVGAAAAVVVAEDEVAAAENAFRECLEAKPNTPVRIIQDTGQKVPVDPREYEQALVEYTHILERWDAVKKSSGNNNSNNSNNSRNEEPFNPDCKVCIGRKEERLQDKQVVQKLLGALTDRWGGIEDLTATVAKANQEQADYADLLICRTYNAWSVKQGRFRSSAVSAKETLRRLTAVRDSKRAVAEFLREVGQRDAEQTKWTGDVAAARVALRGFIQTELALIQQKEAEWATWDIYEAHVEKGTASAALRQVSRRILEAIVLAYPHFLAEKTLLEQKAIVIGSITEKVSRLETLRGILASNAVSLVLKKIEVRREILECLSVAIQGYTKWLYTERLAPLLQRGVSSLLEGICEDRPLFLEAVWDDKVRSFSWFLLDGTTRTVLQKASGFQRFIVGMAMRIAMSRLGLCQATYRQFFIDEGFTACDGENLEKVPAFLRTLLTTSAYSMVVLATHLEELKSCGDVQIGIQRGSLSGVGRVCVGTVIAPPASTVQKAGRGRPKKTPVAPL